MSETALARARPLLKREFRHPADRAGYLDLLDREPTSTGAVQDMMLTSFVPMVYERWWRPGLGRLAKGVLGPSMADEHRIARLLLALSPGDGVLDVACGPGNFSREFARAVGASGLVVGIDASRTMLERAAHDLDDSGVDNVAFVRGDAVELPFRSQSFDAVCCFAALHLFANPLRALDRMRAVLAPGGRIALFTTCRARSSPLRAFDALAGRRGGMRMFEQDEIVGELERRGFGDIRQRISGFTQFVGGRLAA